jgi:hypothetical protein
MICLKLERKNRALKCPFMSVRIKTEKLQNVITFIYQVRLVKQIIKFLNFSYDKNLEIRL